MVILSYILILFLQVYCISVIVLLIILLGRKKRLPWLLMICELVCIGLFFLLKFLIMNNKIAFIGSYSEGDNWGAGLANVMFFTYNLLILIGMFILTQILVGIGFSKELKKLNW